MTRPYEPTVDGVPYTVHCWKSHLDTLPTKVAKRAYVAQLLKDAAHQPTTLDLTGTVIL